MNFSATWPSTDLTGPNFTALGRCRNPTNPTVQGRFQSNDPTSRANSHASASCSTSSCPSSSVLNTTEAMSSQFNRQGRQPSFSRYARLQSQRRNLSRTADWPVRPSASSGKADRSRSPDPRPARGLGLDSQTARSDSKTQSAGSPSISASDGSVSLGQEHLQGPTCRWPGGPTCPWPGGTQAITLDQLSQKNPQTMQALAKSAKEKQPGGAEQPNLGTFWALLVLGLAYLHHSTTG